MPYSNLELRALAAWVVGCGSPFDTFGTEALVYLQPAEPGTQWGRRDRTQ